MNKLSSLESNYIKKLEKTQTTKRALQKILKDGHNKLLDEGTGLPMTDARRQEIYDTCIISAEELIEDTQDK